MLQNCCGEYVNSTPLNQASLSLPRAGLYLHPERPRQGEIMQGQSACPISFRSMPKVPPPSQDPASVTPSQWAGVTLVGVFLLTETKEGVV